MFHELFLFHFGPNPKNGCIGISKAKIALIIVAFNWYKVGVISFHQ